MDNKDLNYLENLEYLQSTIRAFKKSYLPSYNDLADYNTNSQSYYDYLAKFNKVLSIIVDYINELMKRDVNVEDTDTIDLTKLKSWINCYQPCKEKNTEILFKADVIFSEKTIEHTTLRNGLQILDNATYNNSGVFTPNFKKILDLFDNDINENLKKILKNIEDIKNHYNEFLTFKRDTNQAIQNINNEITQIKSKITNIEREITQIKSRLDTLNQVVENLKMWHNENLTKINKNISDINILKNDLNIMSGMLIKIVNNLYQSGAIDSNQSNFNFINNIANGNINFFSKSMDSNFYIKTNKNSNNYDIAMGVDD